MALSPPSRKAREIFEDALECGPPDTRAAFIARACGGDAALLSRVEALIQASDNAESMLPNEPPPAFPAAASEQPGDHIGRYKLLEPIGEGGCGVVYMAEQEEPVRRKVALKLIKPGMDSKSVIARFEAERQALALMDHPNIARVFDAGTTGQRSEVGGRRSEIEHPDLEGPSQESYDKPTADVRPPAADRRLPTADPGRPFFVMELVRGMRLTDYCTQHNLSTRQRLDLFTAVCSAVQHAHQKGIIHRDLKPSNILVTEIDGKPVPKVIDFGIARATEQKLTDKTLFTQFAQFIGTPAYMSPEQTALSGADIDTRSDIYSLGVLLYELLTGTTPFDTNDLLSAGFDEMRRIIRETEPPKPSTRLMQTAVGSRWAAVSGRRSEVGDRRMEVGEPPAEVGDRKSRIQNPKSTIPTDLDWIVLKCLEKDRSRRYETASGLAADIQRHLANEPVAARPASASYRFRRMVRRNRAAFAAGAAVLAALVAGLSVSIWMFFREKHARDNERQALARAIAAEKAQSEERRMAESEAARSNQIAGFLENMLKGIAPSVALGEDTKLLRRILNSTAERIGTDLKGHPEVEADLRDIIGTVYGRLGDYDKAVAMFEEALAISRRIHGPEHPEVSELLNNLALELGNQGKLAEAEAMLHESLAMKRRLGVDRRGLATSIDNLALVLADRGRYDEAEKLHREALAMKREAGGKDDDETATSLNNLAVVLQNQQKFADAETALREALAIERKQNADDTPLVAITLNNLAGVVQQQNRIEESVPLFSEVLALQRKLLGNAHPNVATALNGFGLALLKLGKGDEAEPLLREGVEIVKQARGATHPETSTLVGNLGRVMEARGEFDEAEALYREALNILGQQPGPEHPHMASWRNQLVNLFFRQAKWPELEAVMRESLASARRAAPAGDMSADVADALIYLANPLVMQQKFPEAETLLLEANQALQQMPQAPRNLQRDALSGLVRLYENWDKPDEVSEWREKAAAFGKADAARDPETKTEPSE